MLNKRNQTFSFSALVALAALSVPSRTAEAQVTIVRNNLGGSAPASNTVGTGNLDAIVNAACDWWEAALVTSPYTLTLNYRWGPRGGGVLASHSLVAQGGTPNRETEGTLTFDNDGSTAWFLDGTPCDNSEWPTLTQNTGNYGGGTLVDQLEFTGATGLPVGNFDLFSTALHEIGHALGISSANTSFQAERTDNDIDVLAPLPFAGSALPLNSSSAHLTIPGSLMFPFASSADRVLPSEADLLANAQLSSMTGINLLTSCPSTGGPALTTTFASNNGGNQDGAVYFSLEAISGSGGVTISSIDLNCNATIGTPVSIDVFVQPNAGTCSYDPLGNWVPRTSANGTAAGLDAATNFALAAPIELGEGCCLGVAIVANGFGHRYSNGLSNPEVYNDANLRLTAGSATNIPFGGAVFEPRIVNTTINYALGGTCTDTAVATAYGSGCVQRFTSFYEELTPTAMDLSGREVYATPNGTDLTGNTRTATLQAIGSLGAPTTLALGDDDQLPAGTLGIVVGSNGWIAFGPGNSNAFEPSIATMLDNPSAAIYAWTDLEPNAVGSGPVVYEESGTQWMVTFDAVLLWGTTDSASIQFRGDTSTGAFEISFGALATTGPENWLVGRSGAGVSADPGPRDLSQGSLFGFPVGTSDQQGLALSAVVAPVLGQAFQLETTNIPASAVFHVGIVGVTQLQTPLSFAFSSANPECTIYASTDIILGPDVVFGGPGSVQWQGIDLTSVSALGANLYFQSATLDLSVLSETVRTSNGLEITTGLY